MAEDAEVADATLTAGTGAENKAAEAEVEGGPNAGNATVAAADDPVPNGNDFAAAPWVTAKSIAFDADDPSVGGTLAPNDGVLAPKNLGNATVAAADDTV